MSELYLIYGIFTICAWGFVSLAFQYASPSKFFKKHLKNRKKILFFFALFSIALFWVQLEAATSLETLEYIWIANIVLFLGYIFWSSHKVCKDYSRIKSIESRRK